MDELQKYYAYLKSSGADVPGNYDSFRKTLQDEGASRKYYDYLNSKGFDTPDSYDSFAKTFGLKNEQPQGFIQKGIAKVAGFLGLSPSKNEPQNSNVDPDNGIATLDVSPEQQKYFDEQKKRFEKAMPSEEQDANDPLKTMMSPYRQHFGELMTNYLTAAKNTGSESTAQQYLDKTKQVDVNNAQNERRRMDESAMLKLGVIQDQAEHEMIPEAQTGTNMLADYAKSKGIKLNTREDGIIDTSPDNLDKLPKNNETINTIVKRLYEYRDIRDIFDKSGGDFRTAAVMWAEKNNPHLSEQLKKINEDSESAGVENTVPPVLLGKLTNEFIKNPNVALVASKDPYLAPGYQKLKDNTLDIFPEFGVNTLATEMSRQREMEGKNGSFANFNFGSSSYMDRLAARMYEKDPMKKKFYDEHKEQINKNLETPGFLDKAVGSIKSTVAGNISSAEEFLNLKSEGADIYDVLKRQSEVVPFQPIGWAHQLSSASGEFGGIITTMMIGDNWLQGLGLVNDAANANKMMVASSFWGDAMKEAKANYVGQPDKQFLSAGATTLSYVAGSDIFPAAKINGALKSMSPEIGRVVDALSEGSLAPAAARDRLVNAFGKLINYGKDVLKQDVSATAELTAITAFKQGMDKMLGLDNRTYNEIHPASELLDVAKTAALGSLGPSVLAVTGQRNAHINSIFEMASKPEYFKNLLNDQVLVDKNTADAVQDKVSMLDHLGSIKDNLDNEGVPESKQKSYLLQSVNEKLLAKKVIETVDPVLKKKYDEQLKETQKRKEDILGGKPLPQHDILAQEDKPIVQPEPTPEPKAEEPAKESEPVKPAQKEKPVEPAEPPIQKTLPKPTATEEVKPTPVTEPEPKEKEVPSIPKEKEPGVMKKAASVEDLTEPRDIVLQHFSTGGKIHPSAIKDLFGGKDERIRQSTSTEGERKSRIGLLSKKAPGIKELAHQLWEKGQTRDGESKHTDRDYVNAIEQVLLAHVSPGSMAKDLAERYVTKAVRQELTPEETEHVDEGLIGKLSKEVDGIDEPAKTEITNLLKKYQDRYGFVDWNKLHSDTKGFEPDILELSQQTQKKLHEIVQRHAEPARSPEPKESKPDNVHGKADSSSQETPERIAVKKQLTEASEELSGAKSAFDSKRKELDKTIVADREDLFGSRKSSSGAKLFDERVDPTARDKAIAPLKERMEKAKAEVERLQKKYDGLQGKESNQSEIFKNESADKKTDSQDQQSNKPAEDAEQPAGTASETSSPTKEAAQAIANEFEKRFGIKIHIIDSKAADALLSAKNGRDFFFQILDDVDVFDSMDPVKAKDFITEVFKTVANEQDAKKAYRKLAIKYHPDKKGSEDIMKHLNNIYEKYKDGTLNSFGYRPSGSSRRPQNNTYEDFGYKHKARTAEEEKAYQQKAEEYRKAKQKRDDTHAKIKKEFSDKKEKMLSENVHQRKRLYAETEKKLKTLNDAKSKQLDDLQTELHKNLKGATYEQSRKFREAFNIQKDEIIKQRKQDADIIQAEYAQKSKQIEEPYIKASKDLQDKYEKDFEAANDEYNKSRPRYQIADNGKVAGFYDSIAKEAYFVHDRADESTLIHEGFSHPFIQAIESKNKPLFDNLIKEAKAVKSIEDFVNDKYEGESQAVKDHEYIARAIDLEAKGQLKSKKLIDYIKDFWKEITSIVKDIFAGKDAKIENIDAASKIKDLVDFVLKGNTKLDVKGEDVIPEAKRTEVKFSDNLRALAQKVRESTFGEIKDSGNVKKLGTSIDIKEAVARAIEFVADGIDQGEKLIDAIKAAIRKVKALPESDQIVETELTDRLNEQIMKLTGVNPNPVPQAGKALEVSKAKIENALKVIPEDKPGFFSKVGNFFKNFSEYVDNPNRRITKLQKDVEAYYKVKTGKIALGRVFEQNVRGLSMLKVQEFAKDVIGGLNRKGVNDLQQLIFNKRIIDRHEHEIQNKIMGEDVPSRQTGNITAQDAVNSIADMRARIGEAKMNDLERRTERMQHLMEESLVRLVDSGVISKDSYDAIKKQNDFYAPFNVVQELVRQNDGNERPAVASNILKKIQGISYKDGVYNIEDIQKAQDAFKAGKITKEQFYDAATNILNQLHNQGAIGDAELAREMGQLADSGFAITNIIDKAASMINDSYRIAHRNEQMARIDKLRSLDADHEFLQNVEGFDLRYDSNGSAFQVPKRIQDIKVEEGFGVVGYRVDGKQKFLSIDVKAANAINKLDRVELAGWMKGINAINAAFRTAVITLSPAFQYANFVIDFLRSASINKFGVFAGKSIGDSVANAVLFVPQYAEAILTAGYANFTGKKPALYKEFMQSKGYSSGMFDNPFLSGKKVLNLPPKNAWEAVKQGAHYLVSIPEKIGTTFEQSHKIVSTVRGQDIEAGMRIGLTRIKNLISAAKTPANLADALDIAAYETQNFAGSPNFPATHSGMKVMSVFLQFFSARVKGEMTDYRRIGTMFGLKSEGMKITARERAQMMAQFGAVSLVPKIIMAMFNHQSDEDEKQYKSIPVYDRNNNMHIPYGSFEYEDKDGDKQTYRDYIKIPVRGVEATINTIANDFIDYTKKNDPDVLNHSIGQTIANASPLNLNGDTNGELFESGFSNLTPLFKWAIEFGLNRDTYKHRDLIPDNFGKNGMLAKYQRGDIEPYDVVTYKTPKWAIQTSKWLKETMGISITPITLDHMENTFAGNISESFKKNAFTRRMLRSDSNYPVKEPDPNAP